MADKLKNHNQAKRVVGAALAGTLGATLLSGCSEPPLTLKRPSFAYLHVEAGHTSVDGCFVDYIGRLRTVGTIEWLDQSKDNDPKNIAKDITTPGALTFVDFGTGARHPLPKNWLSADKVYKPRNGETFAGDNMAQHNNPNREEILCHQELPANALPKYFNKQFASLVLYNGNNQFTSLDGPLNSKTYHSESGQPLTPVAVDGSTVPLEVRRYSLEGASLPKIK